jgi:3-oxoacyl-[acyl-carrier protein] reductase
VVVELTGKYALVTGGSRGIGRAITLGLARHGATVMACYRNDGDAVESLDKELEQIGGDHRLVSADVAAPEAVDELTEECREHFGALDVVVNNAGVTSRAPIAQLPLAEWQRIMDTNLTGVFLVTQKALPLMRPGASIVNIGSRAARAGPAPWRGSGSARPAPPWRRCSGWTPACPRAPHGSRCSRSTPRVA